MGHCCGCREPVTGAGPAGRMRPLRSAGRMRPLRPGPPGRVPAAGPHSQGAGPYSRGATLMWHGCGSCGVRGPGSAACPGVRRFPGRPQRPRPSRSPAPVTGACTGHAGRGSPGGTKRISGPRARSRDGTRRISGPRARSRDGTRRIRGTAPTARPRDLGARRTTAAPQCGIAVVLGTAMSHCGASGQRPGAPRAPRAPPAPHPGAHSTTATLMLLRTVLRTGRTGIRGSGAPAAPPVPRCGRGGSPYETDEMVQGIRRTRRFAV
jgi:hypothetical protein